jgi:prepilin-type N-terminal cleavage/methylation domain-containing protein
MKLQLNTRKIRRGFSLIEALVTLVLIGILAKIAISNFAGAVPDSSRVVARQQQAVIQEALNCWVSKELSTPGNSVNSVYGAYNSLTAAQRIENCLRPYLAADMLPPAGSQGAATDPTTFILEANGALSSAASRQINGTFVLADWALDPAVAATGNTPGRPAQPSGNGPTVNFIQ